MSKLNLQRNRVYEQRLGNGSRIGVLLAAVCFLATASAEDSSVGLSVETIAESRRGESSAFEYVPADRIRIGEQVFYTLRVRNDSGAAMEDAVVIKALPRNTRYVADSAAGPGAIVTFSVDGAKTFASAETAVVINPDGSTRPAVSNDYTHIRWKLRHPLAAGATALIRFRGVFK